MTNGNGTTRDIVARLWNLCNILRDDGITYTDYVTELTFLLFLKMLAETGREGRLPAEYRWATLAGQQGLGQLEYYRQMLLDLGNAQKSPDSLVLAIFTDAQTKLRKPANLKSLTDAIDKLDWFSAREEGLGNLYEGLLEKNAAEKKSGAGQYFTPRPLIDCIVRLVKPKAGEVVQDPAAGAPRGAMRWCPNDAQASVRPAVVLPTAEAYPAGRGQGALIGLKPGEHAARGGTPLRPQGCKPEPQYGYTRKCCRKHPEGQHAVKQWGWRGSSRIPNRSHCGWGKAFLHGANRQWPGEDRASGRLRHLQEQVDGCASTTWAVVQRIAS